MNTQEWFELGGWILLAFAIALAATLNSHQKETKWKNQNDTSKCLQPMSTQVVQHYMQLQWHIISADGTGVMLQYMQASLFTIQFQHTDTINTYKINPDTSVNSGSSQP